MKNNKGFTLVELLAVIVILAIIMLIAIPAILNTMEKAKRKSFITYVDKIGGLSSQKYLKDSIEGKQSGCYLYNIKNDFDLSSTGSFKGYVLVKSNSKEIKYYITLWNDDYMLVAYNYTDGINYKEQKKSIEESLEIYDSSRSDELKPSTLCNYACNECTYDSAINDPYDNSGDTNLTGDITKIKGASTLLNGTDFTNAIINVAGSLDNVHEFKKTDTLIDDATKEIISSNDQSSLDNPVYIWYENNIIYFYSDATKIFLNSNSAKMFYGFKNVEDFGDIINYTYANKVSTMSDMFADSGITKVDISNWDTPNLTNMNGMFSNTTKLKKVNLSNINTSKVTNMKSMFYKSGIEYVDLSMLDTSSLERISNLFDSSKIVEPNMSTWKTPNLKDMNHIFRWCTELKRVDLNSLNLSGIKALGCLFEGCSKVEEIVVSNWDIGKIQVLDSLFKGCSSLKILNVSKWDTSNVTNFYSLFYGLQSIKTLDVSHWNTSKATNMGYMFYYTSNLQELDISNFDTKNVTNMSRMFQNCGAKELDFSRWSTPNLKSVEGMFYGCQATTLDLRTINVSNCTNFSGVFHFASASTIDISTWNTSKVTNMFRMFCFSSVQHVYIGDSWSLASLDTSTSSEMFHKCDKIHNWNGTKDQTKAYAGSGGYFEYK
ncbi:MAG: BspA family leucine-rich repeat surface protein [Bacilli bacterium]|nr:BspA family leucine-rich repeat surface protein [Bacilli bacterium]